FLTIVFAVWLWAVEKRAWLRWLGVAALAAVLGRACSAASPSCFTCRRRCRPRNAGLAEIFFGITVAIALFTSPRWNADVPSVDAQRRRQHGHRHHRRHLRTDSRRRYDEAHRRGDRDP